MLLQIYEYGGLLVLFFYRHDSVVNNEINYDLLITADGIQSGRISCPQLLGDCLLANSKTKETIPPAVQKVYSCTP